MDWKHTFLFLVVAIPSVAILTRVIGWLADRKKRKRLVMDARQVLGAEGWMKKVDGIDWIVPPVGKPYATHEEYMNDLRGTVDLEEFLARCRAGVPKDPKKAALASDMAKIQSARERLAAVKERIEKTPVSSLPNAAVPVASGWAGGAGGDASGGARITGIESPPPAESQQRLQDVAYNPKLQDLWNRKCPRCGGLGLNPGGGGKCQYCACVTFPNVPR